MLRYAGKTQGWTTYRHPRKTGSELRLPFLTTYIQVRSLYELGENRGGMGQPLPKAPARVWELKRDPQDSKKC